MQPYPQGQISTRKAVLIFLKTVAPPLVLYVDNPEELYEEIKTLISKPLSAKLMEKAGKGPLKKFCVPENMIAGVAIQEEPQISTHSV